MVLGGSGGGVRLEGGASFRKFGGGCGYCDKSLTISSSLLRIPGVELSFQGWMCCQRKATGVLDAERGSGRKTTLLGTS